MRWTCLLVLVAGLAACSESEAPLNPVEPPQPAGNWRATHIGDAPLPARIYLFDPDTLDGQPISVHFVVDSARLRLDAAAGYQHVIFFSEWHGEAGGPPLVRRLEFKHGDFGEWQRGSSGLGFFSHWLQNHEMHGTLGADGVLRVWHGLGHGEEAAEFRYAR